MRDVVTQRLRAGLSELCHKSVVPVIAIYSASTQPESIRQTLANLPMSTAAQREAWWDHMDSGSTDRKTLLRLEPEEILGRITGDPSRKVESASSGTMARKVNPKFTLDEVVAEEPVVKGLEQLVNRVKLEINSAGRVGYATRRDPRSRDHGTACRAFRYRENNGSRSTRR